MDKKKYMLFGFDTYYPCGGMHDFITSFNLEEYDQLKKYEEEYEWLQILDVETLKTYTAGMRSLPKITNAV